MSYLQFDKDTLCNAPYPLNEIKYRLTFYKISGLSHNLNEIDYANDGVIDTSIGIRKIALGLPLGVILSQYDVFRYRNLKKRGILPLRVGFEDVFMPFEPATDPDHGLIHISIHGDDIKKKQLSHDGAKIVLSSGVIRALEKKGSVLYKMGGSVYRLNRAERVQYVREDSLTANSVSSNYDEHSLTQNQFRELSETGKLTISYRGDSLEFHLARRSQPGQRVFSMARSSGFGNAGEVVALLTYGQRICPPRNYNEFDKILGCLAIRALGQAITDMARTAPTPSLRTSLRECRGPRL